MLNDSCRVLNMMKVAIIHCIRNLPNRLTLVRYFFLMPSSYPALITEESINFYFLNNGDQAIFKSIKPDLKLNKS